MAYNIKHKLITYTSMLLLTLPTLSCVDEATCEGPEQGVPTRTLLVYLAGDNNLSAISQIPQSILSVWKYTGNHCIIYYDAPDATPKLLSLRGGCSTSHTPFIETIAEYKEENSASAAVFERVIHDVFEMYPADSYGLLFCSHSSGWLPTGTLAKPSGRSIGSDQNPGTSATSGYKEMELSNFATAIADRQFDFIIFESCLMAGVEVAYELRNKTKYILASSAEILSPGFLPIYKSSFNNLMNTKVPVEESLKEWGLNYFNEMNTQSGVRRSATLSLIKTEKMAELASQTSKIIKNKNISKEKPDLSFLQHFDRPGSYGDNPVAPRYFDFGEYIKQLTEPSQYAIFSALMDNIVIWKASTPYFMEGDNGFPIQSHSGLTTYIEQDIFPFLNEAWRLTAWRQAIE